jgi:predicted ATPase
MFAGGFASARSHLEKVLAIHELNSHRALAHQVGTHPQVNSRAYLSLVLFCLGFPKQALAQSDAAVGEARELVHPPSLALALGCGSRLLALVGDIVLLNSGAEELISVSTDQSFPLWQAFGTIHRGWAKVQSGHVGEGISLLRGGSADYRATGSEAWMPHYTALLAEACEIAGQIEDAVALLDDALQIGERTGEHWFAAELNRHKGQLLLRQGQAAAAEELYRKALCIAREQEAKLWELRATVSLARLRRGQGRRAEARDLLAPVYGWFTEGFDTPDLRDAKALLDELA